MEYVSAIAALVALIGAGTTLVTFWMNRGKNEAKSDQALSAATLATAKVELIYINLAEFKAQVAREYVTIAAIDKVEQRLTVEVHRVSSEFGRRFDELTKTLIDIAANKA